MESNSKTFDSSLNQLLHSKLDHEQALAQLTAKYLHDLPRQLDAIRNMLEVKDYTTIKKHAHRIKGTSGTYHLDAISQSAAQLERLANSQNQDTITAMINKVKQLIELETSRVNSQIDSYSNNSERNTNG